jgi:hypothetical protein
MPDNLFQDGTFMNWPWLLSPFPLSSASEERGIKLWNA